MIRSTTLHVMSSAEPLSGRRAQAARNDETILASAREVFIADPGAPIAAVAQHAGVGISALYRRFAGKEDLLRELCGAGLQTYLDAIQAAVDDTEGDPWDVFVTFMTRAVDSDTTSLTVRLAGTFEATKDLWQQAAK